MKFSGKMCLKITLKVTKDQDIILSSEDTLFEKPHGGQIDPHRSRFWVKFAFITKTRHIHI